MTHFASATPEQPDAEALLRRVVDVINGAKSMPLSASVLISKDEVLELLDGVLQRLPEELKQARWMIRERDEYLARVAREGDQILDAARTRAARMVERAEIVREARYTAQKTIDDAGDEARRLRLEAEDFCDHKLAQFEIVLERTMKMVLAGRDRLRSAPAAPPEAGPEPAESGQFFDQDQE